MCFMAKIAYAIFAFVAKISDVFDNSMSATFKIVDFIFIFTRIEQ